CRVPPQSACAVQRAPIAALAVDSRAIRQTKRLRDLCEQPALAEPAAGRVERVGEHLSSEAMRQIEPTAVRAPCHSIVQLGGIRLAAQTFAQGETVQG